MRQSNVLLSGKFLFALCLYAMNVEISRLYCLVLCVCFDRLIESRDVSLPGSRLYCFVPSPFEWLYSRYWWKAYAEPTVYFVLEYLCSALCVFHACILEWLFSSYLLLFSIMFFVNAKRVLLFGYFIECCVLFAFLICHKIPITRVRRLKRPRTDYVPVLGLTPSVAPPVGKVPEGPIRCN